MAFKHALDYVLQYAKSFSLMAIFSISILKSENLRVLNVSPYTVKNKMSGPII